MKFSAQYLQELIPASQYFKKENDKKYEPRYPRNRRSFYYHVCENSDRSFIESGSAVQLLGYWYIWPRAVAEWAELQAKKTVRNRA
jgi:hypothetical protein